MNPLDTAIIILTSLPIFGFLVAAILILSAKKQVQTKEMLSLQEKDKLPIANVLVLLVICGTNVAYGLLETMMLLLKSGKLDGNIIVYSLPSNFIFICSICAILNCIAVIAKGFSASISIRKNLIQSPEGLSKAILYLAVIEPITLIGLCYFILSVFLFKG